MAKNIRPEVNNPLANMGLDEIVRGITAPDKVKEPDTGASEVQDIQKEGKRRRKGRKALEENLAKAGLTQVHTDPALCQPVSYEAVKHPGRPRPELPARFSRASS